MTAFSLIVAAMSWYAHTMSVIGKALASGFRLDGLLLLCLATVWLVGCSQAHQGEGGAGRVASGGGMSVPRTGSYAIAIHGGAGYIPRDVPAEQRTAIVASLERALAEGRAMLERGEPALDVVEHVVALLEDDPLFNAGRGAVFTAEGRNELDASIMEGSGLRCGAVAGVTTVRNPIRLARRVMMDTRHVLLAREGAERFADTTDLERVDPAYFYTAGRWADLERVLKERGEPIPQRPPGAAVTTATPLPSDAPIGSPLGFGTVGCVALDKAGNLAAATSTGGLTAKRFGRIGDSPVIGAGTYADNQTAAVSSTGTGEEYIRRAVAYDVCAQMRYGGRTLERAARDQIFGRLEPDVGGLIAVSHRGEIAMFTNTGSMPRAEADSRGLFRVMIWESAEPLTPSGGAAP